MLKVGLTGGIGAGKSAAVSRLAALGAVVVDSDRLAREVVEPGTDGLAEVVAAFGPEVLDAAGALDRPALGRVVFGDPDARRRLEAILHPRIRARSAALNAAAPADAIVVNDVPLLVESGIAPAYHLVIVVDAKPATRVERLVRDRGMTRDEATARIAAQIDDATRRAAADVVLDNGGDRASLDAAVDALWADRLVPFERNVRERVVAPRPAIVHLVEPDPTWPAQYERLAARLRHHLGDRRIDHVGSTSVPGLPAKDIIDMQLTVESVAEARRAQRHPDRGRVPGAERLPQRQAEGGRSGPVGEAVARHRRPGPAGPPAPAGGGLAGLALGAAVPGPAARRSRAARRLPRPQAGARRAAAGPLHRGQGAVVRRGPRRHGTVGRVDGVVALSLSSGAERWAGRAPRPG